MWKQTHQENTWWLQRQRLEWWSFKPRNAQDWQPPPETRKRRILPAFQRVPDPADTFDSRLITRIMRNHFSVVLSNLVCVKLLWQIGNQSTSQEYCYEFCIESFHGCLRKKKYCQLNNDNPVWCTDWSHLPLNAAQHPSCIPRGLAISCVSSVPLGMR